MSHPPVPPIVNLFLALSAMTVVVLMVASTVMDAPSTRDAFERLALLVAAVFFLPIGTLLVLAGS